VILTRLNAMDEAPWGDWHHKPLDARGLAGLLKPYGVHSRTVRTPDGTPKGYHRADLVDAWRRYVRDPGAPPQQTPGPPRDAIAADRPRGGNVADGVTEFATRFDQRKHNDVPAVADASAEHVDRVTAPICPDCTWPLWSRRLLPTLPTATRSSSGQHHP
jgi:hypothetical protein